MIAERYRPNFVTGFEEEQNHFENSEQLLDIDWVKSFANHSDFHRFSLKRDKLAKEYGLKQPCHSLMAEVKNGFEWWVVAFIRDEDISGIADLPEWEAKYETNDV